MAFELNITSQKEFKDWLDYKPKEWSVVLAQRCALRVLPLVFDSEKNFALQCFRAVLRAQTGVDANTSASYVPVRLAGSFVASAAADAASAAFDAAVAAADAAAVPDRSAAAAVIAAYEAASIFSRPTSEFWRVLSLDCSLLFETGDVSKLKEARLWHELLPPVRTSVAFALMVDKTEQEWGTNWQMLSEWYDEFYKGGSKPLNDLLINHVVNQPEVFWEGEPDDVMEKISNIIEVHQSGQFFVNIENDEVLDLPSMKSFILDYLNNKKEPVSISEFISAFFDAGYDTSNSSIRGRLNELTANGEVFRVGRGLYSLEADHHEDLSVNLIELFEQSSTEPNFTQVIPVSVEKSVSSPIIVEDQNYLHSSLLLRLNCLSDECASSSGQSVRRVEQFGGLLRKALGKNLSETDILAASVEGHTLETLLKADRRIQNLSESERDFEATPLPISVNELLADVVSVFLRFMENDELGKTIEVQPPDGPPTVEDKKLSQQAAQIIQNLKELKDEVAAETVEFFELLNEKVELAIQRSGIQNWRPFSYMRGALVNFGGALSSSIADALKKIGIFIVEKGSLFLDSAIKSSGSEVGKLIVKLPLWIGLFELLAEATRHRIFATFAGLLSQVLG
ncbi:hypothetical protein [Hirschia litorea]|uniref:Uncharacterized protein n=1 Tax=Hirschia litorea TaxID=1199156 RepID=A0ABW2IIX6_9PROT